MIEMSRMRSLAAGVVVLGLLAACGGGGGGGSAAGPGATQTTGVTITVAYFTDSPPKAALDEFTKETGITVKWSNVDYDSLQTKIAAAATSKTYFADATDVDWSRVGQVAKLDWFYPITQFIDTKALATEMPQLGSFTSSDGKVVAIPLDAAFLVTTTNKRLFAQAGITKAPTTITEYTEDLKQIKAKGLQYPLNIPFAAAEGLSTYWYQTRPRSAAPCSTARASRSSPPRTPPATRRHSSWSTPSRPAWCHPATSTSATARVSRR